MRLALPILGFQVFFPFVVAIVCDGRFSVYEPAAYMSLLIWALNWGFLFRFAARNKNGDADTLLMMGEPF